MFRFLACGGYSCLNGGTCNQGRQICECANGFTGLYCSFECGVPRVPPRFRRNSNETANPFSNADDIDGLTRVEPLVAIINGSIAGNKHFHVRKV